MNLALLSVAVGIVLTLTSPKLTPTPEKLSSPSAQKVVSSVVATPSSSPIIVDTANLPRENFDEIGMASYYSREGCLGCSKTLTMANGQPLDDSKLTVAYNHVALGSIVEITNTKTGDKVQAEVTDTGGFERHNRIIDLTIATRDAIKCSHLCEVHVSLIRGGGE